jgi:DNA-binding GntR family transcriptional regulator
MHETIAIPADRLPGFTEQLKLVPDLLYVHLLERYDIRISAVREKITAELASQEDETLLGLAHPSAVLAIDARNFAPGNAGVPFYKDIICPVLAIALLVISKRQSVVRNS